MNTSDVSTDLESTWHDLVTAALLGTDRRSPPIPQIGQVADLVADAVRADDAARMLAAVAAVAAARRAAFVPGPPGVPPHAPDNDPRPWCSAASVGTWRVVIDEWPVLEDEWVLTVVEQGFRLPPDAVVGLLARHRGDAVRRTRAALAAGPVAGWLTDHVPSLAARTSAVASTDAVVSLPDLPVPPDLAELLGADARSFSRALVSRFESSSFGPAHKAVLVNLIARCRPAVLLDAAAGLDGTRVGLGLALADLARLRHRMLVELGVPF